MQKSALHRPRWYEAMLKAPPLMVPMKKGVIPIIEFKEDKLINAYYEKLPERKKDSIDLTSEYSNIPAVTFVQKQLEFMSEGITEDEAFAKTLEFESEYRFDTRDLENLDNTEESEIVSLKETYAEWSKAEEEFWSITQDILRGKDLDDVSAPENETKEFPDDTETVTELIKDMEKEEN